MEPAEAATESAANATRCVPQFTPLSTAVLKGSGSAPPLLAIVTAVMNWAEYVFATVAIGDSSAASNVKDRSGAIGCLIGH